MPNPGKYAALAEQLAGLINTDYSPGDQFLTNYKIAERYGVSGHTVSRAVQALKERGLLSGKVGGKTWVRVPPVFHLRSNESYHREKKRVHLSEEERRSWGVAEAGTATPVTELAEDTVRYAIVDPPQDVADLMGLSPGRKVLRKSAFRRNSHGEGASTAVFYLPYDVVSANPELLDPTNEPWPGGLQHQLSTLGIEVDRIEDRLTADLPTAGEAKEQDIPPGVPMMRVRKITYDTNDRVVEVADIPFPGDRAELRFITRLERWA
ncbi:GntR family transcriptional regulator [Streptomyces lydicus]|uniref:GntR family transcriptional regulator n=1 Tax=Streptomyces lydicus TaxID=47763 RepID=UPI00379E9191